MKHLLMLFAVVALMTSCTFYDSDVTDTVNLNVQPLEWHAQYEPSNSIPIYYSCTFPMPEITPSLLANGLVQVYVVFDNGAQQVLPYVQHFMTVNSQQIPITWTRTIDYRIAAGELSVFVTNSDFVEDPPSGMNFKFVMIQ
jgi:hypothetical protein